MTYCSTEYDKINQMYLDGILHLFLALDMYSGGAWFEFWPEH
jgi:hypothetical protein